MAGTNKIPHPQRKNPESRRRHDSYRAEKNAVRPKQKFDKMTKTWSR